MTFPLHPKTSIQILHTVFFIFSYGTDKENLFDNQELHKTGYYLFPSPFHMISVGNHMISNAIWDDQHELIFPRLTKL